MHQGFGYPDVYQHAAETDKTKFGELAQSGMMPQSLGGCLNQSELLAKNRLHSYVSPEALYHTLKQMGHRKSW
jgi:hypothetical protein